MKRRVIRREEDRLLTADGVPLLWRSWTPNEMRRAVVLVHGLAEHSGRYDAAAAWWASQDCAVHAYDHRGHGRSEGALDGRDALQVLIDDLRAVVERVRKDSGDLPLVLLGHGVGGLVALRALATAPLPVDAAITSAAALEVGGAVSPARVRVVGWLARLAPRLPLAVGVDPSALCRDPRVVRAYRDDDLVRKRLPVALGASVLSAMREGTSFASAIRVPVLLMHGESDALCPPQGSRSCRAALSGPGHGLHLYPNLRHEIMNEPEREGVLQDALGWLEERGL